MPRWFDRAKTSVRTLYLAAKNERATPREIGWAVGVGFFAGCTPTIGFHGWVAVGLATFFKLNRLYAFLGSRICNVVTLPFVVFAEIQISHVLRTGRWLEVSANEALKQGPALLLDWIIGMVVLAGPVSVLVGWAAFLESRRRQRKRAAADSVS